MLYLQDLLLPGALSHLPGQVRAQVHPLQQARGGSSSGSGVRPPPETLLHHVPGLQLYVLCPDAGCPAWSPAKHILLAVYACLPGILLGTMAIIMSVVLVALIKYDYCTLHAEATLTTCATGPCRQRRLLQLENLNAPHAASRGPVDGFEACCRRPGGHRTS